MLLLRAAWIFYALAYRAMFGLPLFGRQAGATAASSGHFRVYHDGDVPGSVVVPDQYSTITIQYTPPGRLTLGAKQTPSEYPERRGCESDLLAPSGSRSRSVAVQANTRRTPAMPFGVAVSKASLRAMLQAI